MEADDRVPFDPVVHQAEGVVASQLKVPVDHAHMILRIRARDRGVPLDVVAEEVVAPLMSLQDPNIAGSC